LALGFEFSAGMSEQGRLKEEGLVSHLALTTVARGGEHRNIKLDSDLSCHASGYMKNGVRRERDVLWASNAWGSLKQAQVDNF
jgi:hypothetical protein